MEGPENSRKVNGNERKVPLLHENVTNGPADAEKVDGSLQKVPWLHGMLRVVHGRCK